MSLLKDDTKEMKKTAARMVFMRNSIEQMKSEFTCMADALSIRCKSDFDPEFDSVVLANDVRGRGLFSWMSFSLASNKGQQRLDIATVGGT